MEHIEEWNEIMKEYKLINISFKNYIPFDTLPIKVKKDFHKIDVFQKDADNYREIKHTCIAQYFFPDEAM